MPLKSALSFRAKARNLVIIEMLRYAQHDKP